MGEGDVLPLHHRHDHRARAAALLLVTELLVIAVATWDSLLIQARGFSYALDAWDLLGMAASGAQVLILMLQMLGISYLLYALGRRLLKMIRDDGA